MPAADTEPGMSIGTAAAVAPALPDQPPGERVVTVLWSFGKCLGALVPVYLAGYYGFSISVVLLGLMIYMGWKHSRLEKVMRLKSAMYLLENEKACTTERVFRTKRDLPPWGEIELHLSHSAPQAYALYTSRLLLIFAQELINFPDVEKVEWLNKILQQAWPFVGQYLEKLLVETVAPAIRASSIHLQTLSFTKVNIGDKQLLCSQALKVAGVKAHTEHDKRQVMLDLYLSYAGDVEVNVEIKKYFCKAGVKGIQLHGKLRVILEPLIGDVPLVGAITMFFIRRPKLDINWTGLTNLLDIPGLNAISDTMIMDAIASFLVLPNRLTVPLVADLHIAQLRSPLPRVTVPIINGPETNEPPQTEAVLSEIISCFIDSPLPLSISLSFRVKVDLDIVKKARVVDDWFNLRDVPSGSVHLRLEWLSLLSSADRLSEVIQMNQNLTSKTADPPSAAILAIYLDQAYQLPMRKGNKDPSPMVQISIQDTTKESKTCYGTNNPVWEDAFTFFIQDPRKQDIDIQVKDDDRALSLGSLTIPLTRILAASELTMDQWFQLEDSGSASRIYIKIVLRVLWLSEDATPTTPSPRPSTSGSGVGPGGITSEVNPTGPGGLAKPQPARPQNTTPDPEFATEGVLRIHLVEAQNLIAKDNFMGGMVKGKSDPYVKIRVAGITFRSHTIKENLNPTWNELYEVILTQLPGQEIQFELFDKDLDQDDFLGRFKLSLRDIISAQFTDTWYTLNDVKSGRVHLVLEWLSRVSDLPRLEQILQYHSQLSYQNKVVPSAAILFVYVERAHGLPLKKSGKDPKVGAEIILKGVAYKTKVCERSTSPRWDEAFHFLVRDPRDETLTVKLSHSWGQALGSLTLPLREVLSEPSLVLDRWLNLDGALPESQILLRATLKVLTRHYFRAPGDATNDANEEEVIPRWVPSHLDIRHRAGFSIVNDPTIAGQVKLTLGYSTEESRFYITVHSCRALAACSKDGADPYVSFILLPDKKGTTKRRTATKKRDLNPEFNERFDFDLSLEESTQRKLDLSVKNNVSFMSRERELIGKLQLDLDQIDLKTGVTQWYDLVAEAN
ncbi:hypothetical protein INR49_009196 [Caranx melampygus]|nr:hypothetical protein INR49_009196 [Caranx melampygus]